MPSLPFSAAPVQAARPFAIGGDALDHRRALLCLTQAVYYEAGFEPMAGRRAVAQVVLNRMRHPAFPKSVCGVVYQRNPHAGVPVQLRLRRLAATARPAPGAWREARGRRRGGAGRLRRDVGRLGDPLSRRLCRAALGADADQGRQARRAHLLSLAGRVGHARRLHRPLHRRAARSAVAAPAAAAPTRARDRRSAPSRWPMAGPADRARADNDVGGLLDTSKGWTLNIPVARTRAAARRRARSPSSRRKRPSRPAAAARAAAPVVAAR